MLAAVRVRASTRTGIELILPNPSGARGVYILTWPGVRALCQPTVHDTMLVRRLVDLPAIDPASIRDAALTVALEGYAGSAAAEAARTTIARDGSQRDNVFNRLLTALAARLDTDDETVPARPGQFAGVNPRREAMLHLIAPAFGRPAAYLADSLAAMADQFAPAGIAATDLEARIPRLLTRLDALHTDLSGWLAADPEHDTGGLGHAVMLAAGRTGITGAAVLAKTRTPLTDPAMLLRRWMTDEAAVRVRAARCDWLLDGWERIVLLWRAAGPGASRRAALLEMAPLLPMLPPEVLDWTGALVQPETMEPACRVVSREDGWRTGRSALVLIERNETLRAMSL
jgi:hypothetical protein